MNHIKRTVLFACLLLAFQLNAQLKLPGIFSDNMVLQRDAEVRLWGWADAGNTISASIDDLSGTTVVDKHGYWEISLPSHEAGGPHILSLSDGNTEVNLDNVLFGDVWFCSGQSNMGWKLVNSDGAEEELSKPDQPQIRLSTVRRTMSSAPNDDVTVSDWAICSSRSMRDFSGVAYFFGQYLQENLDVPIGLINSSWGGTNVQAWMSPDAVKLYPRLESRMNEVKGVDVVELEESGKRDYYAWLDEMESADIGSKEKWFDPSVDKSSWDETKLPTYWKDVPIRPRTGIVWVSRKFTLTSDDLSSDKISLSIGRVDDEDLTFINGVKVGESTKKDIERVYDVSTDILKEGENELTIRVKNKRTVGGFRSSANKMYFKTSSGKIELAGSWKYKIGTPDFPEPPYRLHPNDHPALLYNGMVSPIVPFNIKGVIWYQGESNVKEARSYDDWFKSMIVYWRKEWGNKDMPFLFVQLANYGFPSSSRGEYYAELRNAQIQALELSNVGMAVAIDLGENDDIHPSNKKDVGVRLGLTALKIAYDKNVEHSGPTIKSFKKKKGKLIVSFTHNDGIKTLDGKKEVLGFEVAEENGPFKKVVGRLSGQQVEIDVSEFNGFLKLRYAWANDPMPLNLVNKQGLPAVPFTSESDN